MIGMKEVSQNELKEISLNGLKYFADFCKENKLRYYLAYGTLLGAIRHKGFIPWDDDIDVWMPREDYDILINQYSAKIESEEWELLSYEINSKFCFPWAKLCNKKTVVTPSRFNNGFLYGISIDIFPQDTNSTACDRDEFVKDFSELRNWYERKIKLYFLARDTHTSVRNFIKKCLSYLRCAISGSYISVFKQYSDSLRQVKAQDTIWYGAVNYPDYQKKEWFDEIIKAEFEGVLFDIPKEYDKILTTRYGNYMQLPPENERKTNHSFVAYYK